MILLTFKLRYNLHDKFSLQLILEKVLDFDESRLFN